MASTKVNFFFLLHLLFLLSSSSAHNITQILAQFSDFSSLNELLTRTQLASEINRRQTITVLAVNNAALSAAAGGQPMDVVKRILSVHVVLDYYDADKLHELANRSVILTTLFQASGMASGQTGFLNVTKMDNGDISFGSAVHGSPLNSNFMQILVTHPFNISVLKVSNVILPPGIAAGTSAPSATPKMAPTPTPNMAPIPAAKPPSMVPPAASPRSMPPAPSAGGTLPPSSKANPPSHNEMAPAPSNGAADGPWPSDTPSEAPFMSPPAPVGRPPVGSPTYTADAPARAKEKDGASDAGRVVVAGAGAFAAMGVALFGAL